ncbi:type II toxin-antitoxin system HicB family antitoxin [Bartonella harrusi]|uniref:Type II toxin-antitoxin system HicB family antitoxin n=1 Tax=Bartonella harrusi TaxID=2961895 RepID=A0ABY5EWU3_9HYPH|nr:type II toxin-antitoxin system HicB family antitoxin [Bartonella harrusi]UTO28721.1 type II toxin-antitoxin system HicB family antitoxin [Bartonella harrusi]
MKYAIKFIKDDNDTLLVISKDFQEFITYGNDEKEALEQAKNALLTVIMGRFQDREVVPLGAYDAIYPFVEVSSLVTLKIAIHNAMIEKNLRKADLVRLLELHPIQIDRLLDLNHATKLDALESTLLTLGKEVTIHVQDAA